MEYRYIVNLSVYISYLLIKIIKYRKIFTIILIDNIKIYA